MLAEDYARPRVFEFLSVSNPPYAALLHNKELGTDCGQKLGDISAYIRPDRWEEFSQQANIVSGAEEWRARLARLEKHYQREAQRQATQHLDRTDPVTGQAAQEAAQRRGEGAFPAQRRPGSKVLGNARAHLALLPEPQSGRRAGHPGSDRPGEGNARRSEARG